MLSLQGLHKDEKIAILGFGKEGQSTLTFLRKEGYKNITILDATPELETYGVPRILGDSYMDTLRDFKMIIKSPGISPHNTKITPFNNRLYSQTQIFFELYEGKVIGITGTKGKSTVSSLTCTCLEELGYKVKLVGNIGNPVLDEIDFSSHDSYDYIVYELSSYMLEGYSPNLFMAYINNIFPCHLDWHKELSVYTQAKYNILENSLHSITHSSLIGGKTSFPSAGSFHYENPNFYSGQKKLFESKNIKLLGEHNMVNICGVLSILDIIELDKDLLYKSTYKVLQSFNPLKHRLETIGTFSGITFIDDGAAVTPDATITAINAVKEVQTILLGGKDIGMNQLQLEERIKDSGIINIVLFPDTGYDFFKKHTQEKGVEKLFHFTLGGREISCIKTMNMETAIKFSYENTQKDKSVLLSSAAQSYSLWKNFEEKGYQFEKYIKKYAEV